MSRIQVLPDQIINLIAAGEVIERPASVVKELIENSLDAAAKRITIETFGAGRDFIRVCDDGIGIARDELPLALQRHATSKLSTVDELWHLRSLGFRGEALASIAEVARVELVSKTVRSDSGYVLSAEGGKVSAVQAVGAGDGTRITVEDLFFNTPARAKYLKKQSGENRHIIKAVQDLALANHQVCFTLVVEGQTRVNTPGNGGPLEAAAAIFGSEFAVKLVEIKFENAFGKVSGWLGQIGHYASSRSQQVFSVNGRVFQHTPFVFTVENAYKGSLPARRFPVFAIDIAVDASSVDVNVHPAKQEVRFQHEAEVRGLLYSAVKATLDQEPRTEPVRRAAIQSISRVESPPRAQTAISLSYPRPEPRAAVEPVPVFREAQQPQEPDQFVYFGQINETYLIWEHHGNLVLMDQHAAHERILFEEILAALSNGQMDRQELLFPQTLHLAANEIETVRGAREALERFGFSLEEFGGNSLLLRGLPLLLAGTPAEAEVQATILELASALEDSPDQAVARQDHFWQAAQVAACHGAIRAGQKLDSHQARKLIRDWLGLGISTCPHGRPIVRQFNQTDLAKLFLRS